MPDPIHSGHERIERLFAVSSYVTLGLAVAALVWAEHELVPAVWYFAALTGPLLALAYVCEGRWSLSVGAANALGIAIAGLAVAWAVRATASPPSEGPLAEMPWPTSMVPLLGPLLLVLLPAKLFRPKSVADHWGLQVIGLACVGLGCALTDDGIFGLLLALYLLSLMWCLAQFFLFRERPTRPAAESAPTPRPRQVLSWAAPIFALALAGFFVLPRSSATWRVPQQEKRLESGVSDDGIDLNRTGTVTMDSEVAFEVFASDRTGNPVLNLPDDQRWRGTAYRYYSGGRWRAGQLASSGATGVTPVATTATAGDAPPIPEGLPDYQRDDVIILDYLVRARIGSSLFVADPVYRPDARMPVVYLTSDGRELACTSDFVTGAFKPREKVRPGKTRYRQVTAPPPAVGLSHPVARPDVTILREPPDLPPGDARRLRGWVEALLARLAAGGRLSREAVSERDVDGNIHPHHFGRVARALEHYLADSGEFTYSLTLDRQEHDIDPALDFLFNTRKGHCNRFASALAVMLRILRVPCQVVLGFRGAEPRGDGYYDVRQYHAHAWVEVLVTVREPPPAHGLRAGRDNWHWLAIDPSPTEAVNEVAADHSLWFGLDLTPRRLYRELIVGYSAENRDSFVNEVVTAGGTMALSFRKRLAARTPEGFRLRALTSLAALALAALTLLAARWLRRRLRRLGLWPAPPHPGTAFYQRMLTVLARHGMKPGPTQTPREFADVVSQRLAARPTTAPVAGVVGQAAELYYRVRFGGQDLSAGEVANATDGVNRLARALAGRGN